MRVVQVVTGALTVVMVVTILAGLVAGGFADEGEAILDLAWGRVTLIDLYVGLALFGGWIALRERSATVLLWVLALVTLGNLAAAFYAFVASLRSDSIPEFLLGRSADATPSG